MRWAWGRVGIILASVALFGAVIAGPLSAQTRRVFLALGDAWLQRGGSVEGFLTLVIAACVGLLAMIAILSTWSWRRIQRYVDQARRPAAARRIR